MQRKQQDQTLKQLSTLSDNVDSSSYYKVHFKGVANNGDQQIGRKEAEERKKEMLKNRMIAQRK